MSSNSKSTAERQELFKDMLNHTSAVDILCLYFENIYYRIPDDGCRIISTLEYVGK